LLARCPDAEDATLFSGFVLRLCGLVGGHDQAAPWGLWVTGFSLRSTPVEGGIDARCLTCFNNDGADSISNAEEAYVQTALGAVEGIGQIFLLN
jgi:hypothetical protein